MIAGSVIGGWAGRRRGLRNFSRTGTRSRCMRSPSSHLAAGRNPPLHRTATSKYAGVLSDQVRFPSSPQRYKSDNRHEETSNGSAGGKQRQITVSPLAICCVLGVREISEVLRGDGLAWNATEHRVSLSDRSEEEEEEAESGSLQCSRGAGCSEGSAAPLRAFLFGLGVVESSPR